jgi:hypothetical protein
MPKLDRRSIIVWILTGLISGLFIVLYSVDGDPWFFLYVGVVLVAWLLNGIASTHVINERKERAP